VELEDEGRDSELEFSIHKVEHSFTHPIMVDVIINDKNVKMEVDTGAAITVLSEKTTKGHLYPMVALQKLSLKLKTYVGEAILVLGAILAKIRYG